ncbi:hypothetical protein C8F04DRAFT_237683 [Mycena alexandri]|uniref:Uncharacterized protein n=1 Tax=Mycena alexandri TaxID=1745969 RepID=A0AAD6T7V2_9AGAR|nr:hypothetical protein C8F04DRAFT_237683 [Mycena alexandri]
MYASWRPLAVVDNVFPAWLTSLLLHSLHNPALLLLACWLQYFNALQRLRQREAASYKTLIRRPAGSRLRQIKRHRVVHHPCFNGAFASILPPGFQMHDPSPLPFVHPIQLPAETTRDPSPFICHSQVAIQRLALRNEKRGSQMKALPAAGALSAEQVVPHPSLSCRDPGGWRLPIDLTSYISYCVCALTID